MTKENIWRYITGDLPEGQQAEVLRWIKENPERIKAYHRLKRDYSLAGSSTHLSDSILKIHYSRLLHLIHIPGKKVSGFFAESLKYAAVIAITLLVSYLLFSNKEPVTPDAPAEQFTQVETLPGQSSKVTLPDGTTAWLNAESQLTYSTAFGQNSHRAVNLQGEAFFDVTRDSLKPFTVLTDQIEVKVLGTSFNLEAYPGEAVVTTLVEGKVELNNPKGTKLLEMKPGEQAILSLHPREIDIREVDTQYYASWKDGYIIFNNIRLEEIAPKLERFYNVDIELQNNRAKNTRINGRGLRNMPVDQLMKVLGVTYDLDYKIESSLEETTKIIVY